MIRMYDIIGEPKKCGVDNFMSIIYYKTKVGIFRLKDGDTFKVLRNGEWVEDTDLWLEFVFNDWIDFETITEEVVKYL